MRLFRAKTDEQKYVCFFWSVCVVQWNPFSHRIKCITPTFNTINMHASMYIGKYTIYKTVCLGLDSPKLLGFPDFFPW